MLPASLFHFKQFSIEQQHVAMKVNTDGVLLGAWAEVAFARRLLDVGTGTGVIALMLAQRNATATIDAVEIDAPSAQQARDNAENSPWRDRITIYEQSFQSFAAQCSARYDAIVSNPPYFTNALRPPSAGRTLARHAGALPHDELLAGVRKLLQPTGALYVVLPLAEGMAWQAQAAEYGLFCTRRTSVHSRAHQPPKRLLLCFSTTPAPLTCDDLLLHRPDGARTPEYQSLTKEFYRTKS